jgi:hypothetical protein
MKKSILPVAMCLVAWACNSSEQKTAVSRSEENIALAERYRHAVETKNVNIMDSLLADNYVGYGPSVGDSVNKSEAIANWKNVVANLYESIEYTRSESLAVNVATGPIMGDWVSNWALLTIKYKDGRGPVKVWVNAAYKIENGKIVRSRTFYNEADVLRQLNYKIEPPSDTK